MSTLDLTSARPCDLDSDVLVLAASCPDHGSAPRLLTDGVDTAGLDPEALAASLKDLGFSGALDAVVRVPALAAGTGLAARTVLVVGTGKDLDRAKATDTNDAAALGVTRQAVLRRAAGRAARDLAGAERAAFALPAATATDLAGVAQGAALGAYIWHGGSGPATPALAHAEVCTPLATTPEGTEALRWATALAEATHLARDLVNEPPNRLTPAVFAERAIELAARADRPALSVEVLDETALATQGFGGILGVGQGSAHPPRLVRLAWRPHGEHSDAPAVALVGKGITFDSGGLSLKTAAMMPEMKSDMAGAAAVLGAVLAAARLELAVPVTAWLALAENMPGADAQRPSDIVTMYGGTTVEITNTDAEGRLVMADALARAVEERPAAVLDVATLTGAQIVALGERVAGLMGAPVLRDEVARAAVAAGEAFWPMPLPEHLRSKLDSPFADLCNAPMGSRAGGMLSAGLFLREFVGDVPWAHLDIAGPAYNEKSAWGLTPVGGTGAGVATLLGLLRGRA